MKYVSQVPIKFLGVGEKIENLEVFHPDRIANRILGMGDIVSLVEKAAEDLGEENLKKAFFKFSSPRSSAAFSTRETISPIPSILFAILSG